MIFINQSRPRRAVAGRLWPGAGHWSGSNGRRRWRPRSGGPFRCRPDFKSSPAGV